MSSHAPLEAAGVVQDDVRSDELHYSLRPRVADTCNDLQGPHHDNELKELIDLPVPPHEFTQKPTTSGVEHLLSQDRTPKNSAQELTSNTFSDIAAPVRAPENSDHCSLRSTTQSTVSFALSNAAASSDADSSAKTVSTAPTSILPCPSGLSSIREVEKGVFAAPKMIMELQDRLAWNQIQPKLQDTIFNTFQPRRDLDDTISCEFMMGGPSPTQLTPTVFLVCCHELYRKQLRSILKRQKWMRAYKYQCVVIVDTLEDLSLGNSNGTSQLLVEAFVPSSKTSWCGLKARALSGVYQQPVGFTIGGILLIDGEAFGLTVKHGIERLVSVDAASSDGSDDDDDDDNAVEESSSPFITFEDEESIQAQDHAETEKNALVLGSSTMALRSCTSLVDNSAPERTHSGSEWRHFGSSHALNIVGSTISRGGLDWSLVKFEPRCEVSHSSLVNTLVTPTNDHLETRSFLNGSAVTGREVWINAGSSGPIKGWLVDCPALLHRHGKTFQVLQVIPDQPLASGDSGSWVLMANVLCGHILASRKSVPWLYVLPISEILAEAKAIMSCQDITLPQHHTQVDLPAVAKINATDVRRYREIMLLRARDPEHNMTGILRACLGTLFLERVEYPRLDYTAFTDHCRSRLEECKATTYGSMQSASCNEDVRDILQMIKSGLRRDELVDTLGQRMGPGSMDYRFIQERIDRIASLLVMTEIGNIGRFGCHARVSWRSGTLQQLINNHFTRERILTDTSIRLEKIFTAKSLVQIAGLRICWTANLSDHLLLSREKSIVHIFHHATYLECQRKSLESLLPDGLADETLSTLALLFPTSSSSAIPSWLRNSVASDPKHDSFLHSIRASPLEPHERDIRHFHYWHDRIVILKQAFDEAPATYSLAQLWHDRRDSSQWYTFWSVVLFGIVSVCLSVAQTVVAGLQLWNSAQVSTVAADRPFPINPSFDATTSPHGPTTSKAKEGNRHNLGPGTIAGITIGGVVLLATVLGGLLVLLRRSRRIAKSITTTVKIPTGSISTVGP